MSVSKYLTRAMLVYNGNENVSVIELIISHQYNALNSYTEYKFKIDLRNVYYKTFGIILNFIMTFNTKINRVFNIVVLSLFGFFFYFMLV